MRYPALRARQRSDNIRLASNVQKFNHSLRVDSPPLVWTQYCLSLRNDPVTNLAERIVDGSITESHGFAVAYYSNVGLELVGGAHQTLKFQATRGGQFQIYCTINCSIHRQMQNGLLNVA